MAPANAAPGPHAPQLHLPRTTVHESRFPVHETTLPLCPVRAAATPRAEPPKGAAQLLALGVTPGREPWEPIPLTWWSPERGDSTCSTWHRARNHTPAADTHHASPHRTVREPRFTRDDESPFQGLYDCVGGRDPWAYAQGCCLGHPFGVSLRAHTSSLHIAPPNAAPGDVRHESTAPRITIHELPPTSPTDAAPGRRWGLRSARRSPAHLGRARWPSPARPACRAPGS